MIRPLFMILLALLITSFTVQAKESHPTVTAATHLPRGKVLRATDLMVPEGIDPGIVQDALIGKAIMRSVYPGYPVTAKMVREPLAVKRNGRVQMIYRSGMMEIQTWGRALDDGRAGDMVSVLNLGSRQKVDGVVLSNGMVEVSP